MAAFPFQYDYNALKDVNATKRKIKLFFDAYGMPCPSNLMDIVVDRVHRDFCEDTAARAAAGDKECMAMLKRGDFDHYMNFAAHVKKHGHEWI